MSDADSEGSDADSESSDSVSTQEPKLLPKPPEILTKYMKFDFEKGRCFPALKWRKILKQPHLRLAHKENMAKKLDVFGSVAIVEVTKHFLCLSTLIRMAHTSTTWHGAFARVKLNWGDDTPIPIPTADSNRFGFIWMSIAAWCEGTSCNWFVGGNHEIRCLCKATLMPPGNPDKLFWATWKTIFWSAALGLMSRANLTDLPLPIGFKMQNL